MGAAPLVPLWEHEAFRQGIPPWSGTFVRSQEDPNSGVLIIHIADERAWSFPEGFQPVSDDPIYIDCMEVWPLVQNDTETG